MMAGVLRQRACLTSSSVLWEHFASLTNPILDQIGHGERSLSGSSASTSATEQATPFASPARRHVATTSVSSRLFSSPAWVTASQGCANPLQAILVLSASRSFSSAAPAAAPNPTASNGNSGASASGGGSSSRFQAPWPWIDPSRPQVLPVSVGKKQRTPVPLPEALTRLLDALPPLERAKHNLEVFIRFRLDPRRSDHLVRGSVVLPYGTGKAMRLIVFAKGADVEIARSEGVELIGDEELISAIVSSEGAAINFDRLIATPEFMKPLARAGKVLGPKSLMPNPKMGTLTSDVAGAIRDIRQGRLDYRLSREATVRAVLGRGSMTVEQLAANVGALVASLVDNRPKALMGPTSTSAAGSAAAAGTPGAGGPAVAAQQKTAAPTISILEGYFMTFILKTNFSPSVHIALDSLVEAATKHRPVGSSSGPQQQQKPPAQEKKAEKK